MNPLRCFAAIFIVLAVLCSPNAFAQHSMARVWNEALLDAIRVDFARPTVHARNLFHISAAMYDVWAAYDDVAGAFFLGKTVGGFACPYEPPPRPDDVAQARNEAIAYASYRLLSHRFQASPGAAISIPRFDSLFAAQGFDATSISIDYESGSPAALGNYLARCIIEFGLQDGSNEAADYRNLNYRATNLAMVPILPGNVNITDPNRWQPLSLDFVDQAGNPIPIRVPSFLSPEWGQVTPFALKMEDAVINRRENQDYWVYHDPGPPPFIDQEAGGSEYAWGFALVALWSSHLDPSDGVMVDISPASFGNVDIASFPRTIEGLRDFYDALEGGDPGVGYDVNPATGQPYEPQIVPRGDYARVLAEFWADGPDSETPPGHWFTILNYVNDHPDFVKRYKGTGPILDGLEWDVKAYFALGGAMHDAAVTAWGIKGWYDYIRPISAIRYMADMGQSTDPNQPGYHPAGIPLTPGYIEVVQPGDPLAGDSSQHVGKIKLYTWRGPNFILDPDTDVAGVGWILAENWWPYQRPTFITPPFAGYISGHSTFSRAAAEVMTLLTGDPFFPGGMGTFEAPKNEFLVFEDGPSVDITLQWATYRDASDQTSLSRIWGGIHPPADDIPGRLIGERIGIDAFNLAELFFTDKSATSNQSPAPAGLRFDVYPNPLHAGATLHLIFDRYAHGDLEVYNALGQRIVTYPLNFSKTCDLDTSGWAAGTYYVRFAAMDGGDDIECRMPSVECRVDLLSQVECSTGEFISQYAYGCMGVWEDRLLHYEFTEVVVGN